MKILKGWLSIGGKKDKQDPAGKKNRVFAPFPGMNEAAKISPFGGRAMDANVVPSTGLEWMDEKNQK